ncbi:DUF192 domain-containing protein [Bradyrhizobium sp. U87765 SZCCT0131]|uniref:DUF192 domain-containing protein n=1 Tax=unclassified Bradyrhizobium TaxID=2631580 RepID=UPI001BADBDFC|nr:MULTISPECIES: DUF192 domain-containing protein [unclassified Bradyrhizobium]MBR1220294.1 DUF192 domain-containing protein [Bradyrhizobium sp. U87765 SZCCT0131]MBR1263251.1 DUF192 domain-containing protein [Bradyrhizobium sp. U87765 SZCCT0134]MBR1306866.1 DUF192 domain-containing protein [Bradyrhizobium sp. U87765 SZCCT0110]MBR1323365.1 DUF192 domain-containing protein [Bradyrhizobium sp. U87765 SZCCT0109]MBR1345820.1 DUF192 domain-containing protein [Bradyrhizobium sp. U87765 SZCCT0048]
MTFDLRSFFGAAPGRRRTQAWLVALVVLCGGALAWRPVAAADRENLEIVTQSGVQVFSVEVMRTDEERARGLMFRQSLPDGQGMLFDFNPEQPVSMWMKNTLIPLDMIFIQSDGRILRIAENTQVQSEKIISSSGPVRGVLEVIAGTAKKLKIRPGDKVAHPLFGGR